MNSKKWGFKKILKMLWIAAGLIFTAWLFYSFQSKAVDKKFLKESRAMKVDETNDFYIFTPTHSFRNVFIFYPGAMVDPKAYLPLCRRIADHGIQVYLVKMPWRLAARGYNKPKEHRLFNDSSRTYILSGHSQGAKMAAQFVYENPALIDKLILVATTHPRDISLAQRTIPVMKIYGSKDGVADEQSIMENKTLLPAMTRYARIDGANHAQFGYYGFQLGDNRADISREQQQDETLKYILEFIGE
jgi:hypothetical protein